MTVYRFNGFQFDREKFELRQGAELVEIQPKVLGLLEYLIDNRERLVSKGELVEALWDRRIVSDDAINKRVALLRKALGDEKRDDRLIRTEYGRGYRFLAEVEVQAARLGATAKEGPPDEADSVGEAPVLAVLPFRLHAVGANHSAIADGLPDDITSALVKIRSLPVIARGSTANLATEPNPVAAARNGLGVGYALCGRVEIRGEELTVYAELVRTANESLIWSESYRGSLGDLHSLRDDIVGQIVNRVEIEIPREEARLAQLSMPDAIGAWESYHLGQSLSVEAFEPDFAKARSYFENAIEAVPGFARARASLAYVRWNRFTTLGQQDDDRLEMLAQSERALELDAQDPVAQMAYGAMRASLGDSAAGLSHITRCLELAPGYARGHASLAGVLAAQGRIPESLASIGRAITLSPRDPHLPTWLAIRLVGNCLLGRMDAVRATSDRLADTATQHIIPLGWALTGYSLSGDNDAAKATAQRLRSILPEVPAKRVPGVYDGLPKPLQAMLEKSFRDHRLVA